MQALVIEEAIYELHTDETVGMVRNKTTQPNSPPSAQQSSPESYVKWRDMKYLGGILGAIFIGLITWYLPKELEQYRELTKADTIVQLQPVRDSLSRIEGQLKSLQLLVAVSSEPTEENLQQAQQIIESAKAENVQLEPQAISAAGAKLIADVVPMPEIADTAWNTVTDLLGYRSFLNQASQPLVPQFGLFRGDVRWDMQFESKGVIPGARMQTAYSREEVPPQEAAVMQRINSNVNADKELGLRYVFLQSTIPQGVELYLDGHRLKGMILRNFVIVYNGGTVILEDVLFVNCTFRINRSQPGVQLAQILFDSAFASFRAS